MKSFITILVLLSLAGGLTYALEATLRFMVFVCKMTSNAFQKSENANRISDVTPEQIVENSPLTESKATDNLGTLERSSYD